MKMKKKINNQVDQVTRKNNFYEKGVIIWHVHQVEALEAVGVVVEVAEAVEEAAEAGAKVEAAEVEQQAEEL